ncbi:MAG: DUF3667 domain-containing protein [Muribaculaceae bacterium]
MEEKCDRKYSRVVCLNCGTECDGKYCPNCGQSTAVGRLTAKNLAVYCSSGLLRVNSTFFSTIGNLICRPWKVVGEFVAGKRVRYTPPFLMLVLLVFYDLLFSKWCGILPVLDMDFIATQSELVQSVAAIVSFLIDNQTITSLILIIPILFAVRLAYRKAGAGRHNWVEYMFAGVFFLCLLYISDIILLPIIWVMGDDSISVPEYYTVLLGGISLYKVFPDSIVKSIKRMALFVFYSIVFGSVYIVGIGAIIYNIAELMSK